MTYLIIFINLITWVYVIYDIKIKQIVKKQIDDEYINGLIDKALQEAEYDT